MRILRIDNQIADIDEQTAIGVTYQGFDVKNPSVRYVNVTNTFSLPLTAKNLAIIGNPQDGQSISKKIYNDLTADYWIENERIINGAKCRITEISDRINVFIFEKREFWEIMKSTSFNQLVVDCLQWHINTGQIPTNPPWSATFDNVIEYLNDVNSPLRLIHYTTNFLEPISGIGTLESISTLFLQYDDYLSGHLAFNVRAFFRYFESQLGVNFDINNTEGDADNLMFDTVFLNTYIPCRNIKIGFAEPSPGLQFWNFNTLVVDADTYPPHGFVRFATDVTGSDFLNALFQMFNVVKDEFITDSIHNIRLHRFDTLTNSDVVDYSGKFDKIETIKPSFDNLAQYNYIKFKSVYDGASEYDNSREIICQNKTLDIKSDMFEINAYLPEVITNGVSDALKLSDLKSLQVLTFVVATAGTTINATIKARINGSNFDAGIKTLFAARIYNIDDEYVLFSQVLEYPKYVEVRKWLNVEDVRNFRFWRQYYFRQLNGSFFVNRIKEFNPEKSLQAVTLELLKVSNVTPKKAPETGYYIDGLGNYFVDGLNNKFF